MGLLWENFHTMMPQFFSMPRKKLSAAMSHANISSCCAHDEKMGSLFQVDQFKLQFAQT